MNQGMQHRDVQMGQLVRLRDELRRMRSRAEGILKNINDICFATRGDWKASVFDVDAQRISDFSDELKQVIAEGNRLRDRAEELEGELGVSHEHI